MSEQQPSQGIPPVSGKPAVSGKRKSNKNALTMWGLGLAVLIAGAIFAYIALSRGDDETGEVKENNEPQVSLTSSRSLTIPPTPPQEPEPKKPEPKKEEEQPEPVKVVSPIVIEQKQTLPALPVTEGGFDSKGNPIPTLEELKYAAPMMGMISDGRSNQQSTVTSSNANNRASLVSNEPNPERNLQERLQSVATPGSDARYIQAQSYTLSKGTVIECILESRVDTTVPGMTTCVIPRDIYSMNGRVLLVEKGTKAIGEYQGSVQNGLARIFMLWTELRTPHGISIQLNSPAADALGGAGMGGYVDYHWWKRFGNALLFSLISDAFQYVINTANSNNNNGDVTYESTEDGMDEIIKEAMRQSGNIPPTLIKNQGERVSIFVARDLNFENVYGIKAYGNY